MGKLMDYRKLRGKIKEVFGTQKAYGEALGLSERSVSLKLNGTVPFTQPEILHSMVLFNEPLEKIDDYFFIVKVQ